MIILLFHFRFFHVINENIEFQRDVLRTLQLESVEISMQNLLELVKASKHLSDLRLTHVDLIGTEKNSAVISALSKFQSELKSLYVNECSETISSFIHILPCTSLEILFIRAKNIEHLRRIIQKNRGLKKLNLQLTERKDPLPRDLLNEIELSHLQILLDNKDNLDPIIESQVNLKSLSTNARLGRNLVKRITNFHAIEELSFKGDRVDYDDLSAIASWKKLKTVKIEFKSTASPMLVVDVLSIFFKKSFKYSTYASDNGAKNFYKLAKSTAIAAIPKKPIKLSCSSSVVDLHESIKREVVCESPIV